MSAKWLSAHVFNKSNSLDDTVAKLLKLIISNHLITLFDHPSRGEHI